MPNVPQAYPFDREVAAVASQFPAADLRDLASARTRRAVDLDSDTAAVGVAACHIDVADRPDRLLLRLYRPADGTGPTPCVIQLHAGGFVMGSIDQEHRRNVRLCTTLGVAVVAVEYRLAPEHPYPAALQDCYAALCWVKDRAGSLNVDPARIALHGRSAGGGLAAATALLARDHNGPGIRFLYLTAPQLDPGCDTRSMRRFDDTPLWTRSSAELSWALYLSSGYQGSGPRPGAVIDAYAAPARAGDLSGMPATYIAVMEFDPLRDEAIAFAQALLAAGVPTELHLFPGTFHCSAALVDAAISRRELAEELAVLRRGLDMPEAR